MIALLLATAAAAPLQGDVQVRLFDDALDVAASVIADLDPVLAEDDLGSEVSCWDRVGVRDFNLDVPIELVGLSPGQDTLTVYVGFGDITGADMVLYAEDEDFLDLCTELELDVYEVAITNAELAGTLQLQPSGDGFAATWFSAPLVSADLRTDLEYIPDDAILTYFEDTILDLVADQLEDSVPPLLDEALAQAAFQGDYEGMALGVELVDVQLEPGSLGIGADASVDFVGTSACAVPTGAAAPGGRDASLPLAQGSGRAFGTGLTEGFVNRLLFASWESGAFCFRSESADTLADRLAVVIDPSIATFDVQAVVEAPPRLTLEQGAMRVAIPAMALTVTGRSDNGSVELVSAQMAIDAAATVGFAPSLTALTLSLEDLSIDFQELGLSRISPGFEEHVEPLLEQQLSGWLEGELARIPVFSSLYYAYGLALVVDEVSPEAGGLELWMGLIDEDELDRSPPDTEITSAVAGRSSAEVSWTGADAEGSTVAFSWQLDDGAWSAWTTDTTVEIWALSEGDHTVAVKARDVTLNEDPTPASVTLTLSADNPSRTGESCAGCSSRGAPTTGLMAALLGLLGLARRRR